MARSLQDHLAIAMEHLQIVRQNVSDEIVNYPSPISGCDAQFNHLLSERQKVSEAIFVLGERPFIPTPRNLERCAREPN